MTAKELINTLMNYPEDADVYVNISEDTDVPILQVIYDAETQEIIIETE